MLDQTHEQAVMLIKASKELRPCELVLVIKPHGKLPQGLLWTMVEAIPPEW